MLPNRMVQQSKKIVQLWKALVLWFTSDRWKGCLSNLDTQLFKPEVVLNLRNDITKTKSMCPTFHVTPTQEIQVLQNYKIDDGNTASISGGSNGSNSERYVQNRKSVREKKRPNWMASGEFLCLVDDSQGYYCLSPIS